MPTSYFSLTSCKNSHQLLGNAGPPQNYLLSISCVSDDDAFVEPPSRRFYLFLFFHKNKGKTSLGPHRCRNQLTNSARKSRWKTYPSQLNKFRAFSQSVRKKLIFEYVAFGTGRRLLKRAGCVYLGGSIIIKFNRLGSISNDIIRKRARRLNERAIVYVWIESPARLQSEN